MPSIPSGPSADRVRLGVAVRVAARSLSAGALLLCGLSACGGGDGTASADAVVAADTSGPRRQAAAASADIRDAVRTRPFIHNVSLSARPGDVISLQGDNFGAAPRVYLEAAPSVSLAIVNRVGTSWLAVQLPADASGAMQLRVVGAQGTSARLSLNAARPAHLDAVQLVPGGRFRLFGRNLLLPGATPLIRIDGVAATIDLGRSDEHQLVATAPSGLTPSASASITVDNGNGSGAVALGRPVEVIASAGADVFGLGVGWAATFAPIAARTIDAASDARLALKAVCNGSTDDTLAIQGAVELAASLGGAVVRLPAGSCRLAGGIALRSNVVLEGAGKAATTLAYGSNYPVYGVGLDRSGLRNLTLANTGAEEGPLLKDSTRIVIQNVAVQLGRSRQMYLSGNRNIVVTGVDVRQTGSYSHQGPYTLNNSAGLVFDGNTTQWMDGAPAFGRVHDAFIANSRFTRDGSFQNAEGTVHSFTMDFAYRIAVIGNTFDVANGPIRNKTRNDGETLLTEGGATARTENLGQVQSATATTLTDANNSIAVDPFSEGRVPENYGIAIVAGRGMGQTRRVTGYAQPTLTIERAWDVVPDASSRYATFVWGLEQALIKGNTLAQNPRGIWLYHTAVRDVDLIGNQISEGGGIYLRSYQNLADKRFMPMFNVRIADNRIVNTSGEWMSYINSVFVNADARAFGVATIGIEMRNNELRANAPNLDSQNEEYAGTEGFVNMMRVENYTLYEPMAVPRLMGTLMTGNTCRLCNVAVRVGTGAGGTTILDTRLIDSPNLLADWATTISTERSTDTFVR